MDLEINWTAVRLEKEAEERRHNKRYWRTSPYDGENPRGIMATEEGMRTCWELLHQDEPGGVPPFPEVSLKDSLGPGPGRRAPAQDSLGLGQLCKSAKSLNLPTIVLKAAKSLSPPSR